MKNKKRSITLHAAKKRQSSLRLKLQGWQTALEKQLVPSKYSQDVDLTTSEQALSQTEGITAQIEKAERDRISQTDFRSRSLQSEEKEARSQCNEQIANAKALRDETIRLAREQFAKTEEEAKEKLTNQLEQIARAKSEIEDSSQSTNEKRIRLNQLHSHLGNITTELDGLIMAAFPLPQQKTLREAIRCGDSEVIESWQEENSSS